MWLRHMAQESTTRSHDQRQTAFQRFTSNSLDGFTSSSLPLLLPVGGEAEVDSVDFSSSAAITSSAVDMAGGRRGKERGSEGKVVDERRDVSKAAVKRSEGWKEGWTKGTRSAGG